MKKSLGLIETQGLAAGIEAADAAVKSANVELIGYELTKGGGWTTIKVQGDVGAVKAAVDAARMAAAKINQVISTRVIPRPSAGLDMLVYSPDTVGGAQRPEGPDMPKPPKPPKGSKKVKEELPKEPEEQETEQSVPVPDQAEEIKEPEETPVQEAPVENIEEFKPESTEMPEEKSEQEAPAENTEESEPESADAPEEKSEQEAPAENTEESEPESTDAPEEKPQDAENSETEDSPEPQEPVVPKPTRKAAQKVRKGGKRGSKQETTE